MKSKPVHFNGKASKDAFLTKSTYKLGLIYGDTARAVYTRMSRLETGAGANLVYLSFILTGKKRRNRRYDFKITAFGFKKNILAGKIRNFITPLTRVVQSNLVGNDQHVAVNIFIGTGIIDRSTSEIFSDNRKVVHGNSHTIVLVAPNPRNKEGTVPDRSTRGVSEGEQVQKNAKGTFMVLVALQVILMPNTLQHIPVTAMWVVFRTIDPGYCDQIVNIRSSPEM